MVHGNCCGGGNIRLSNFYFKSTLLLLVGFLAPSKEEKKDNDEKVYTQENLYNAKATEIPVLTVHENKYTQENKELAEENEENLCNVKDTEIPVLTVDQNKYSQENKELADEKKDYTQDMEEEFPPHKKIKK